MGRWNHFGAWREFGRWCAAAGMGVFVVFSIYSFFFWADPFAEAVVKSTTFLTSATLAKWLFRLSIILNTTAVVWAVLQVIDRQEGEWPDYELGMFNTNNRSHICYLYIFFVYLHRELSIMLTPSIHFIG